MCFSSLCDSKRQLIQHAATVSQFVPSLVYLFSTTIPFALYFWVNSLLLWGLFSLLVKGYKSRLPKNDFKVFMLSHQMCYWYISDIVKM